MKSRVSEICVRQICVNQGVVVYQYHLWIMNYYHIYLWIILFGNCSTNTIYHFKVFQSSSVAKPFFNWALHSILRVWTAWNRQTSTDEVTARLKAIRMLKNVFGCILEKLNYLIYAHWRVVWLSCKVPTNEAKWYQRTYEIMFLINLCFCFEKFIQSM